MLKQIDGQEYFVNEEGEIFNAKGQRILPRVNKKSGYTQIILHNNKKPKTYLVHRLVAAAFIERAEGQTEVNHINGKKEDNRAINLEWITHGENLKHSYVTGLREDDVSPKAVVATNIETGEQVRFSSIYKAARFLKISQGNICMVCKGQRPSASGYVFDYEEDSNG